MTELVRKQLAEAGIRLVAETESHFLFARENLMALVERRGTEVGLICLLAAVLVSATILLFFSTRLGVQLMKPHPALRAALAYSSDDATDPDEIMFTRRSAPDSTSLFATSSEFDFSSLTLLR